MSRYESRSVPEIDLWLAGPTHVFRRVSGVLDSGCSQTLLRQATARALSLPHLGDPVSRRTVGGTISVIPSRVLLRLAPADAPPLIVLFPVSIVPAGPVDVNLFGADLFNVCPFRIQIDRRTVSIALVEGT